MIRVRVSTRPLGRVLCFDLENKPGAYWYDGNTTSIITAFGWKWADERKVHTLLLQRNGNFQYDDWNRPMLAEEAYTMFASELGDAGLVYGHNIRRHDLPMMNANLLRLELSPLEQILTTDTCRDLPKTAGVSKSLANMAGMYGLPGKKFNLSQTDWEKANMLAPEGVELARKRVTSDVLLQERLRKKLLSLEILKPARLWSP